MSLEIVQGFGVPGKVILNTLKDPMEMMKVLRSPCSQQGQSISWLDGYIQMENVQVDTAALKMQMDFKFRDWKSSSQVTIEFRDNEDDETTMYLKQSGLTEIDPEKQRQGWLSQIFMPMSQIMGYQMDDS